MSWFRNGGGKHGEYVRFKGQRVYLEESQLNRRKHRPWMPGEWIVQGFRGLNMIAIMPDGESDRTYEKVVSVDQTKAAGALPGGQSPPPSLSDDDRNTLDTTFTPLKNGKNWCWLNSLLQCASVVYQPGDWLGDFGTAVDLMRCGKHLRAVNHLH